ncbi:MAG: cyclic nucleotide-binding domain-containing protein [Verrucomicrobiales bacterium]|nr:cyclic nucleotide-binding domain-containing protein [Verrucomicrobiales bacterium]
MIPLDSISTLPEVSFSEGDEVISVNTHPETIFFLKSGKVEVVREGIRLALVKTPGSAFGEVSLLLNSPTTATVVALEDCTFWVAEEPIKFLSEHPRVNFHVSRILALRLDAATQYLVDVREQLQEASDHVGMLDGVLDAIQHRDLKKRMAQ